jgi:RHS repeat-associated protein
LEHSGVSESSPYPYFYPDTEVLVYTSSGDTGWRPMPFGVVPWGVEFLFDGRFYDVDPQGRVRVNLSVEANATNLTEADRPFEPYNSRWPEPEDLVRFVDQDNQHLLHNRAGACQVEDRFWFQGVLYRCIADPNDPSSLIVKSTYHVLNADGRVLPVEEFAVARGDSLDEVYGSQLASAGFVGGTVSGSGDTLLARFDGGALPSGLVGGQQPGGIQSGMSSGGVNGMPTDFGFAGQRYDSSTGLIYMGARYYDPTLGRFISPDTIVQQRNDPQSYNRYAYARNNPLRYTDESGHCWGIASGLRNVPGYGVTCNNLDMALTIAQHPEASAGQKAGAIAYIATEGTAHLALAVGGGILAWEGGAAVVGTVGGTGAATTAGTMATAACADGDCVNEINMAMNLGARAIEALSADGDPTNEINALINPQNISQAQEYLSSIDALDPVVSPYNQAMLDRMAQIANGQIPATVYDVQWMTHELVESQLVANGMGLEEAHQAVLQMQGLTYSWDLWPTEMIQAFYGTLSNLEWLKVAAQRGQ